MTEFWKAATAILLTVVLTLALGKREKDLSIVLVMAVCCMAAAVAMSYLEPVVALLWQLEQTAQMNSGVMETLLKAVGIGLVAEIAGMICADGGSTSMAKTIQILAGAAMLCLGVPLFQSFLTLIQEILGQV